MATDDARAWKMLKKVANGRMWVSRMEFMNPMNYTYVGDRQRQQRLDFLASFLDDAEAPDVKANPKMFDGPYAGFTFHRLDGNRRAKGTHIGDKMGPPGVRNGGFSRAGGGAITEGGRSPTGVMAPPPAAPPSQGGPSSFSFCFSSTRGSGSFRHSSRKSGNDASNGPGVRPSSSRRERSWSTR